MSLVNSCSNGPVQTQYVPTHDGRSCGPQCHHKVSNVVLVVNDDQSTCKGVLWGIGAFKFGGAALGSLAWSLTTSPFLVTPLLGVPLGFGLGALVLGCDARHCLDNAMYHLGSRQIKVVSAG